MGKHGEVSLQEIMSLVDTAREYLGPMWVKKSIKAAANLPLKGMVNRKQLSSIHPLGLLYREVEKNQELIARGKPLNNAAALLLVAGLGRNLKNLEASPGFTSLIEQLKQPAGYADAALLAEVSAHWLKLGYLISILPTTDGLLGAVATNSTHTYNLQSTAYTFLPGKLTPAGSQVAIEGNFIYSSWWEAWTTDLVGTDSATDPEVEAIITRMDQGRDQNLSQVFYLDLPPYTSREDFQTILATITKKLARETSTLAAVILCIPQHLPHLYVRHTLPVYAEKCLLPLPKSLLNTLSF